MRWESAEHSANATDEYLFHQLIPYIGNKRKLLELIETAIRTSRVTPDSHEFVDLFAGTGVVSRLARNMGFEVLANDWEPYSEIINRCYLEIAREPKFFGSRSYDSVLDELNALPPYEDWVTQHLCPRDDKKVDIKKDRLFFMRKNGLRIDAIRHQIALWDQQGLLNRHQRVALLAPLLYQCCYNSNTSGVFKGFHNGWGGKTGTALYRIQGDLLLRPALFFDNGLQSKVTRMDAQKLAEKMKKEGQTTSFTYLDPPYNQHSYGANYHVLNSVALWDRPPLSPLISHRGDKAAIRSDWRTERRSAYNYRSEATAAYTKLLETLPSEWIATSYSTDGMIDLHDLIAANHALGDTQIFTQAYKRYRVSKQRKSAKPMTVEFVLLTHKNHKPQRSVDDLILSVLRQEVDVMASRKD